MADGGLDFSEQNFGLSVFVRTLLDTPGQYVRHQVTLAHIDAVDPAAMLPLEGRVVRRITRFAFDDPDHFSADAYDVVMLFGIAGSSARLPDGQVSALTAFMNGGGGLFATGDHGDLGAALSSAVPRVRNMRLWASTPGVDEVSMRGANRNDTNRGTRFDHQSDDVPQVIEPKIYTGGSIFQVQFPHPLLCGPDGVIRVMPDHPHEGQCVEPADTTQSLPGGGPEYPAAVDGGPRPVPEVISMNRVPTGNTAAVPGDQKLATVAQSFGGICAYDGHRAGIGRVVTDATWHHFVNVNLKGKAGTQTPPFDKGFLTVAGQAALEDIRAYYRNLVVWTTRTERIRCMNTRLAWDALFSDRVLEAVLTAIPVRLGDTSPAVLRLIGAHARDALGRVAGQCQTFNLVLDLVLRPALPRLVPEIDPWLPGERGAGEPETVWFDGSAVVDIALGAALVALREAFGEPTRDSVADLDTDRLAGVLTDGGSVGVRMALDSIAEGIRNVQERLNLGS